METINAMGLVCPAPVIEAKKAIARLTNGGIIKIAVDNKVATENLDKMCKQKGYECQIFKQSDKEYTVTITIADNQEAKSTSESSDMTIALKNDYEACTLFSNHDFVVAFGSDQMGIDESLGKILIKGFIYSLLNLSVAPKALLFFNKGVYLTIKNSNTIPDLKKLCDKGTKIYVCGTCVDFYNLKQDIGVGQIVNMYDIVQQMNSAGKVINI